MMEKPEDGHVKPRVVYFTPELERCQGDTEESLEEQFGALRGRRKELRLMALGLVLSTLFYVLNYISDVFLALGYLVLDEPLKCGATIALVYLSSIVTTYISVIWYRMIVRQRDVKIRQLEPSDSHEVRLPQAPHSIHTNTLNSSNMCLRLFYIFLIFILQLAPIVSCILSLIIIWQHLRSHRAEVLRLEELKQSGGETSEEHEPLKEELHDELKVMGMIKLHGDYITVLQTFLQDVPQSLLQISLLITDVIDARGRFFSGFGSWWRVIAILLSVNRVRSATKSYTSSVTTFTFTVGGKPMQDPRGGGLGYIRALWHLLIPVGRASTLVYLTTEFSFQDSMLYILLVWLIMLVWLSDDFQGWNRLEHIILHSSRSWVFIWVAVSGKAPRSAAFYALYYLFMLVQATYLCAISVRNRDEHISLTVAATLGLALQLLGVVLKFSYFISIKGDIVTQTIVKEPKFYQTYNAQK